MNPMVYHSHQFEQIIDKIDFSGLGRMVAVKTHFGEKGCNTYINPEYARKIWEKLTKAGKQASVVDCNVLYKGSRINSTSHIKTAREHGFDMPIEILDGEQGDDFVEINGCKFGRAVKNYDSIIVLSHFKGHIAAGFGGAIKNLGMGLGSRAGKLDMHSSIKPSIRDNCTGCGICAENCPADAIRLADGKAFLDDQKCEGCAMCIAVCNNGAVTIPWRGRTSEELQRKMAEYSAAILTLFPNTLYINVLEKITKDCDCMGIKQTPMMQDVGILYSKDIVAIEKASLDLANKHSAGRFDKINSVDKEKQIEIAEKMGLGSSRYRLIEL